VRQSSPLETDAYYFTEMSNIYRSILLSIKRSIGTTIEEYDNCLKYRGASAYVRNQKTGDQIREMVISETKILGQIASDKYGDTMDIDLWISCSNAYEKTIRKLSPVQRTMNTSIEEIRKIRREQTRVRNSYVALAVALCGLGLALAKLYIGK
jgi:hypothetical protein